MEHAEEHGILVGIWGFGMAFPRVAVHGGLVTSAIRHPCHEGLGREHVMAVPDVTIELG
jgi:hypothetical protein